MTTTQDPNRPYPEGIPWDEAYRQRKRADQAEEKLIQWQQISDTIMQEVCGTTYASATHAQATHASATHASATHASASHQLSDSDIIGVINKLRAKLVIAEAKFDQAKRIIEHKYLTNELIPIELYRAAIQEINQLKNSTHDQA
jgi:hypothetical protein